MVGPVADVDPAEQCDSELWSVLAESFLSCVAEPVLPSSRDSVALWRNVSIAGALLVGITVCALIAYWKSDRSLWTRALQLDTNNPMAHLNLGAQEDRDGNSLLAEQHFEKAVER